MVYHSSHSNHIIIYQAPRRRRPAAAAREGEEGAVEPALGVPCLRTKGVNTNGAAAQVMHFESLKEKKVRPGIFGNIKVG